MKINIKSILKNITEKTKDENSSKAIKEKNKITYQIDDFKYIIKIISKKEIIMNRSNEDLECTIYFELNKIKSSIYTLKKEGYTIEIDIKTTYLKITDNKIEIHYTVIDSNTNYEYLIEMSENNEY